MTLNYAHKRPKKDKSKRHFWRATAYLRKYKRLVIQSIIVALFAGGIFAGGLGVVLPVLRVLLNGDTPQMWIDRQIAEARWNVDLADDPESVRVLSFNREAIGGAEGAFPGLLDNLNTDFDQENRPPAAILESLADGNFNGKPEIALRGSDQRFDWAGSSVNLQAGDAPWYLATLRPLVHALPSSPVGAVACLMLGILLLTIFSNTLRFLQEYWSNKAALSAVNDVRRDLYDHVLRVPTGYFGLRGTGDVTSRIVNDAMQLQEGFRTLLGRAVQEPIFAFFAFTVALIIDWRLTLFMILAAPIVVVVLGKFGRKMRRVSKSTLQNSSELLGQIESTLHGIRVVKANRAEAHEVGRLRGILKSLLKFQLKLAKIDAFSTPVLETLGILAVGVILVVATYFVRVQGTLSAESALVIFICLAQMAEALRKVTKLNVILQKANAAAERIYETIDLPKEEPTVGDALPEIQEQIAFDSVTFSYPEADEPSLREVSLTVPRGQSVAVVGRNGSGKTTLLSLLPRFFSPDAGQITIDGRDIETVSLDSLRRQIGVVTQEAVVFPGTIAENIAYSRPDASREAIESAAKQAEAHDFVMAKGGYDVQLTGLGGGLSGGQRQRLNIARAILKDPPILILDEATSQVDAESEHAIQQAIVRLMQGRTVFVIAHRFSTILDCDRIVLMDAGRIEAVGTHDELQEGSDIYRQLYQRQLVPA